MPAFQHYALFDESLDMLRDLLESDVAVVPEVPVLAQPALDRYQKPAPEIAEKLRAFPCMLLEGPFTKHPLQFERRDSGSAAGTYFVDTTVGPRIRWCLSGVNTTSGRRITPGSIGHEARYFDPVTKQWENASAEVKQAFKTIVAALKRHMVRVTANSGERVWVGKKAAAEIERGELILER